MIGKHYLSTNNKLLILGESHYLTKESRLFDNSVYLDVEIVEASVDTIRKHFSHYDLGEKEKIISTIPRL